MVDLPVLERLLLTSQTLFNFLPNTPCIAKLKAVAFDNANFLKIKQGILMKWSTTTSTLTEPSQVVNP
jgi:hypothetical protein